MSHTAAITNIHARMKVRHLRADRQLYHRWRPTSLNLRAVEVYGGCAVRHSRLWDHEFIHHPHGTNIAHSVGKCYFWFHRLPGEVGLRKLLTFDFLRRARAAARRRAFLAASA